MKIVIISILSLLMLSCQGKNNDSEEVVAEEQIADESNAEEVVEEDLTPQQLAKAQVRFFWKEDFTDEEKKKIRKWLLACTVEAEAVLGWYPFSMGYVIHRVDSSDRAVIFGRTRQKFRMNIHFYVDPSYPAEDFMTDWIAPHEISHLAMPFIGRQNAWFSEGFATYISRKIMLHSELYTDKSLEEEYRRRLKETSISYQTSTPFIYAADSLKERYNYPHFYWGGLSYFYIIDQELSYHDRDLTELIMDYQNWDTRLTDSTMLQVIASWDEISGTTLFSDKLYDYQTLPARQIFEDLESYWND